MWDWKWQIGTKRVKERDGKWILEEEMELIGCIYFNKFKLSFKGIREEDSHSNSNQNHAKKKEENQTNLRMAKIIYFAKKISKNNKIPTIFYDKNEKKFQISIEHQNKFQKNANNKKKIQENENYHFPEEGSTILANDTLENIKKNKKMETDEENFPISNFLVSPEREKLTPTPQPVPLPSLLLQIPEGNIETKREEAEIDQSRDSLEKGSAGSEESDPSMEKKEERIVDEDSGGYIDLELDLDVVNVEINKIEAGISRNVDKLEQMEDVEEEEKEMASGGTGTSETGEETSEEKILRGGGGNVINELSLDNLSTPESSIEHKLDTSINEIDINSPPSDRPFLSIPFHPSPVRPSLLSLFFLRLFIFFQNHRLASKKIKKKSAFT